MKTSRLLTISGVVVVAGALATYGTREVVGGDGCCPSKAKAAAGCDSSKSCPSAKAGCETSRQCPSQSAKAVSVLNDAIDALRGGRPEAALAHLAQAKELIAKDSSASAVRGGVVNEFCPVTGNSIDPRQVPDALTREFRGQRIGFCVAALLEEWDGLSEAEQETLVGNVLLPEHG